MIISNTQEVPGKTIVEFFGLVSGSTVRAKHIGRDTRNCYRRPAAKRFDA